MNNSDTLLPYATKTLKNKKERQGKKESMEGVDVHQNFVSVTFSMLIMKTTYHGCSIHLPISSGQPQYEQQL